MTKRVIWLKEKIEPVAAVDYRRLVLEREIADLWRRIADTRGSLSHGLH